MLNLMMKIKIIYIVLQSEGDKIMRYYIQATSNLGKHLLEIEATTQSEAIDKARRELLVDYKLSGKYGYKGPFWIKGIKNQNIDILEKK